MLLNNAPVSQKRKNYGRKHDKILRKYRKILRDYDHRDCNIISLRIVSINHSGNRNLKCTLLPQIMVLLFKFIIRYLLDLLPKFVVEILNQRST